MSKRRIFQIAKELNISHMDILSFLKAKDINVSNHMAPVDDETYTAIIAEFHKDKESVDRLRKEQTRREIHDTRILNQQKEHKKLKLLSLEEQRKLEKKEMKKDIEADIRKEALDNNKKKKLEIFKNKVDFASRASIKRFRPKKSIKRKKAA